MPRKGPSVRQIETEIAKLQEMKPNVRHYSAFGDDHHAAIEAQIEVLTEDMDEDEIYDTFSESGESNNTTDAAIAARNWLDGEEANPPSEEWKELLIRK